MLKKRLMYFAGAILLILVLVVIVLLLTSSGNKRVVLSYMEIETKMVEGMILLAQNKPAILPLSVDEEFTLSVEDLVSSGYMLPIGEYLDENSSVSCTGEITISYTNYNYKYTPFLDCGGSYKTTFLHELLTVNTISEGHGLYQMVDGKFIGGNVATNGAKYIFRGENINNYLAYNNMKWRIIEIDNNNNMLIIPDTSFPYSVSWDDRYNMDAEGNYGFNDYTKSRIRDRLIALYNEFAYTEKLLLAPMKLCLERSELGESVPNTGLKCSSVIDEYIGLLTISRYNLASLDSNCLAVGDIACENYNYLVKPNMDWWLLTVGNYNTFSAFYVNGKQITINSTDKYHSLRPVVLVSNKAIYLQGTGTYSDPYFIR